jgi:hypothetical protein
MGFKSDPSASVSPYGFQIELVGFFIGVSIWLLRTRWLLQIEIVGFFSLYFSGLMLSGGGEEGE